jgi:uncharacterized membrane protein
MHHSLFDLLLSIIIVSIVVVLTSLQVASIIVRLIFALPLVLVLPGYTLTRALFSDNSLNITVRFALSIGLSLALSILGGLVLNGIPRGLDATTWVIWLGGITIIASLVAWIRNRAQNSVPLNLMSSIGVDAHHVLLFGMTVVLVIVAVFYARRGAMQQLTTDFTQLWILPAENGDPNVVLVGITNMESSSVEYHIQVEVQGSLVADWPNIKLEPGKKWETSVLLPPQQSEEEIIKAFLFGTNSPGEVYRQVHIWRNQ